MKFWYFLFSIVLVSCSDWHDQKKAQEIIDDAIRVHGGANFVGSKVTFDFRNIHYEAIRKTEKYVYSRTFWKDSNNVKDVLANSEVLRRYINSKETDLSEEDKRKYSNSVNSVLYFFQLPFTLNDPAATKLYNGVTMIKGEPYDEIKVTFREESGGEDFEDVFYYWIHKKSHLMDYLAYSYQTDGGGVRFREAYNRYEVGGILFQDYINYQAPIGTPLEALVKMYHEGTLEELSRIVNENIQVSRLNKDEGF